MKTENNCQTEGNVAPIIKWLTCRNSTKIEKIECTKETGSFVWYERWGGTPLRYNKLSKYEAYHDSWEGAKQHLLDDAKQRVEGARRALELANLLLENVKCLRKPEGEQ